MPRWMQLQIRAWVMQGITGGCVFSYSDNKDININQVHKFWQWHSQGLELQ